MIYYLCHIGVPKYGCYNYFHHDKIGKTNEDKDIGNFKLILMHINSKKLKKMDRQI